MKRIDTLTPAQKALLPAWRDRWTGIGLSTEPADRPRAEAAYRACYRFAGLRDDVPVVWVSSPLVGALAAALARGVLDGRRADTDVSSDVYSATNLNVRSATASAFVSAVAHDVSSAVYSAMFWSISRSAHFAVTRAVESDVESALDSAMQSVLHSALQAKVALDLHLAVTSTVKLTVDSSMHLDVQSAVNLTADSPVFLALLLAVNSAVISAVSQGVERGLFKWHPWIGGSLWPAWSAYASFFRDVLGLEIDGDIWARTRAYEETALSACYWWPNRNFIMACERPRKIARDERGRLHSVTGQAIEWPDGWGLHMWHGVHVPAKVIERPEAITLADIAVEPNAEVRRVMVERYGPVRYARESGATIIDHSEIYGTLTHAARLGDEPIAVLEVVNRSPEPDGTYRRYWLRVSPTLGSAQAAWNWLSGYTQEFRPTVNQS